MGNAKESKILDGKNKAKKASTPKKPTMSYVNVNRALPNYREKYRKEVEEAICKYATKIGKASGEELTGAEWKNFFKTELIPLDKLHEQQMIELFKDDREELNKLLILHNTKASDNIAEVYYKRYQKNSPTQWHDLEDFKQMALEGLSIAANRFDPSLGNKFITFATWWILNKVRRTYQEKGALLNYTSLNAFASPNDDDNQSTLEEILDPDKIAPGWTPPGFEEANINPIAAMEKEIVDENMNLYSTLKDLKEDAAKGFVDKDKDKTKKMMNYLMGIVDKNSESYGNKQILLYIFKKVFDSCAMIYGSDDKSSESKRLNAYISEAPKSKSELLRRLNMNEKQYQDICKRLTRGGYSGL